MRITNSMLTNNMLLNMNKNLEKISVLEDQMATGKKIQFPSDNPIIAGKSLKLRTNLYETEQYSKNISDGQAWMNITEKSIDNVNDIMARIRELCVQGSNGTLSESDREKIGEEIEQLREQLVQESNVNNAGRYIFAGHKTNKKVMFDSEVNENFKILETFDKTDAEAVKDHSSYAYKLPYDDIKTTAEITIDGQVYSNTDPNFKIEFKSFSDADAYDPPAPTVGPAGATIHIIQETGEIVFNDTHHAAITNSSINIEYEKDNFKSGDLNPVHYFDTVETINVGGSAGNLNGSQLKLEYDNIIDGTITGLIVDGHAVPDPAGPPIRKLITDPATALGPDDVRLDLVTGTITAGTNYPATANVDVTSYERINKLEDEKIEYEVSRNTKLQVNVLGKDIVTVDMIKDLDMLIHNIENMPQDELGKEFSAAIGDVDNHSKDILKEHSSLGSRMNRIDLIEKRLEGDKINYTQLMSDNEDIDIAEVITKLNSQQMVYQASLMASSKVIQQSLVDFIR